MNDQQFAGLLRQQLDDSTEHLPYRVTHRLQLARQAALARVPLSEAPLAGLAAGVAGNLDIEEAQARRWPRATAVLSLMVLVAGLIAISVWSDLDMADETAEIDMAVLTDEDVPISAYADRGFGVFLKNSQQ